MQKLLPILFVFSFLSYAFGAQNHEENQPGGQIVDEMIAKDGGYSCPSNYCYFYSECELSPYEESFKKCIVCGKNLMYRTYQEIVLLYPMKTKNEFIKSYRKNTGFDKLIIFKEHIYRFIILKASMLNNSKMDLS